MEFSIQGRKALGSGQYLNFQALELEWRGYLLKIERDGEQWVPAGISWQVEKPHQRAEGKRLMIKPIQHLQESRLQVFQISGFGIDIGAHGQNVCGMSHHGRGVFSRSLRGNDGPENKISLPG